MATYQKTEAGDLPRFDAFVNGKLYSPASGAYFDTMDPYASRVWAHVARCDAQDADAAVAAAKAAFESGPWPAMTATQRGAALRKLGDLLGEHAEELAHYEVRDNGKLINEMLGQMKYLPQWYYYYAGLADKIQGSVIPIDKPEMFNYTVYEPLGVIAALTPWNSPLLLLSFKLAPALAAGNTFVVKPSEFTSTSTLRFAELVTEAGIPDGVFNVITGLGSEAGAALVNHPDVAKVTFTGGVETGKRVYEDAAKQMKRCTLELGGKSPNIVFEDANLENAVKGAVAGIFAATGQTCIAGSRLLVQNSIYDEFVEKLVSFAKTAKIGDPMDTSTEVGPITTPQQYEKVLSYIDIAKKEGAKTLLGGKPAKGPTTGDCEYFVQPTIFGDVDNSMRIAQEEVFGPVLSIIRFKDEADAVQIANDIIFGLGAGVWTESIARAMRMSKALKAGTVWINNYRVLSYMSPFGGYKQSGVGRENGIEAIKDFLQTKSVWISSASDIPNPFVLR